MAKFECCPILTSFVVFIDVLITLTHTLEVFLEVLLSSPSLQDPAQVHVVSSACDAVFGQMTPV